MNISAQVKMKTPVSMPYKLYYIMAGRAHDEEDGGFFEAFTQGME